NTYKTVKIGEQVWMAENLNYADSVKTPSLKENSWCYGNVAANCEKYGRLYTWAAAIDSVKLATDADNPLDCGYGKTCGLSGTVQGICPSGWHLPSRDEWDTLITAVGGSSTAGTALKSTSGWSSDEGPSGNGTDAFGFSALPAGSLPSSLRVDAHFWSSTEFDSYYAYSMYLLDDYDCADLEAGDNKFFRYSVRCLKD
ncbi:fibrobacter succinogenes major paralogous domain-containing protein, partial [Hallerella sp.]|uniref:fibrobacter succinogenes major paralogous domain-containing protein n=1 Tax=Hallerella sp. TaxID=2815812 RepID=UPI00258F5AF2